MWQRDKAALQIKRQSRRYWLGSAAWGVKRGTSDVNHDLRVVERLQKDIEELEAELKVEAWDRL